MKQKDKDELKQLVFCAITAKGEIVFVIFS